MCNRGQSTDEQAKIWMKRTGVSPAHVFNTLGPRGPCSAAFSFFFSVWLAHTVWMGEYWTAEYEKFAPYFFSSTCRFIEERRSSLRIQAYAIRHGTRLVDGLARQWPWWLHKKGGKILRYILCIYMYTKKTQNLLIGVETLVQFYNISNIKVKVYFKDSKLSSPRG